MIPSKITELLNVNKQLTDISTTKFSLRMCWHAPKVYCYKWDTLDQGPATAVLPCCLSALLLATKINFLSWRCFWCICPSPLLLSRVSRDPHSGVCCMDQNLQTWKGTLADVQNRCCHICNGDLKAAALGARDENAPSRDEQHIMEIIQEYLHLITGYVGTQHAPCTQLLSLGFTMTTWLGRLAHVLPLKVFLRWWWALAVAVVQIQ